MLSFCSSQNICNLKQTRFWTNGLKNFEALKSLWRSHWSMCIFNKALYDIVDKNIIHDKNLFCMILYCWSLSLFNVSLSISLLKVLIKTQKRVNNPHLKTITPIKRDKQPTHLIGKIKLVGRPADYFCNFKLIEVSIYLSTYFINELQKKICLILIILIFLFCFLAHLAQKAKWAFLIAWLLQKNLSETTRPNWIKLALTNWTVEKLAQTQVQNTSILRRIIRHWRFLPFIQVHFNQGNSNWHQKTIVPFYFLYN